ncbi:hypothetical protein [Winogradskyella ouciana]|uniref:Por secretion system C-terminal sorting domain-containing protein n=1 Tax=Winogradskyella ouciana TaxID=2608631 RepID=A0A7K1GCH8_9FLAO|nr:hypothetical protein [Winogradskyella ouciana]MTE26124.1 hypothetical protein [Winogradskyella ouciana]
MKTLIKSILVVAVMFGTYTGYASETLRTLPTFKFINEGDSISVTDSSGEVIYQGRINYNGNLIRLFDFSQLNDGVYTVEISKDFEVEIVNLNVKNKEVTLLTDSQEKIFKPVFRTENSKIIISKIALDTKEMEVELYYEDELIYNESVDGQEEDILNRVYKLDETNRGDYTAIVRTNDRVYIKRFRI